MSEEEPHWSRAIIRQTKAKYGHLDIEFVNTDDGVMVERVKEKVVKEDPVVVTTPGHVVLPELMPKAAQKIADWVSKNKGWMVLTQHSETHVGDAFYAADSKATEVRKGDLKKAAHDVAHWAVQGRFVDHGMKVYAEFWASWSTVDGKTKFNHANMWDYFSEKHVSDSQVTPFIDWLRTLAPANAPAKAKPRMTAAEKAEKELAEKEVQILSGGDWIG